MVQQVHTAKIMRLAYSLLQNLTYSRNTWVVCTLAHEILTRAVLGRERGASLSGGDAPTDGSW